MQQQQEPATSLHCERWPRRPPAGTGGGESNTLDSYQNPTVSGGQKLDSQRPNRDTASSCLDGRCCGSSEYSYQNPDVNNCLVLPLIITPSLDSCVPVPVVPDRQRRETVSYQNANAPSYTVVGHSRYRWFMRLLLFLVYSLLSPWLKTYEGKFLH